MSYPKRLLPQPDFKKIVLSEDLRNNFLIHYAETKDLIDPETKKLRQTLVVKRTDHLRDYSNNLLGVFLTDDIFWAIQEGDNKEYLIGEWSIGDAVIPPVVPLDCKKDTDRGYFFLSIKDCHEVVVPYSDDTKITPMCILLHTPTNANFWHFSLRWFCDGNDILGWTDKQRRRILTTAKTFIIERAFFEEPFFEQLGKDQYMN